MTSPRTTTGLAWGLWASWLLMTVGTTLWTWGNPASVDHLVLMSPLVGYATVGALVASRHPRNAVGWLLVVVAVTISLGFAADAYVRTMSNPGYVAVAWVEGWLFNVWLSIVVGFLPLVFPDGHLLSRRWRVAWWLMVVGSVVTIAVVALTPGELAVEASIENPLGATGPAADVLERLHALGGPVLVVAILVSGWSLVARFRRSRGRERDQLKWFAYAVATALAGLMVAWLGEVLGGSVGDVVGSIGWITWLAGAILGIPVATGIAILRHRLYDIDVVINRTLVYGTLTAALVATYVVSVLVLRLLLTPFTGSSDLWVAGSTLAVAALFRPARARIQRLVDRRFYRHRYDATRTLDEFAHRLRHELDLDAVGADLRSAVEVTVQPRYVQLWLRDPDR